MLNPTSNALLCHLPEVYYRLSVSGTYTVTHVTHYCLSLLGFSVDDLLGREGAFFQHVIHPEDLENVKREKERSIGSIGLKAIEYRMLSKSGGILHVSDQWITLPAATPDNWIMEGRIAERKPGSVRNEYVHQLKAYRDAVDVNLITSITDKAGTIIYVNDNFCKISQYEPAELIGRNHRIICSGYHPRGFFEELWVTIADGRVWHGEICNRAKDGTCYWIDTVILPIFDDYNQIDKYLSIRTLINDRKRAEERRSNYIGLLERIAFIVAHDMRGPLCNILGLVYLLRNHRVDIDEVEALLDHLNAAAHKLETITKKLSDFVFQNEIEMKVDALSEQNETSDQKT